MKSDTSIRNICIAAIKRRTIEPYDFPLTRFFENESWEKFDKEIAGFSYDTEGELPISMVFIDSNNFTVITTRQVITCQNGFTKSVNPNNIALWDWNAFKGYTDNYFTRAQLILADNHQTFEVFIETGKASMVMIYAIRTLANQFQ